MHRTQRIVGSTTTPFRRSISDNGGKGQEPSRGRATGEHDASLPPFNSSDGDVRLSEGNHVRPQRRHGAGRRVDNYGVLKQLVEGERRRLARDIHDLSGQHIVAALFQVAAVKRSDPDPSLLPRLSELYAILEQLSDELHDLVTDTSAAIPEGRFLTLALSQQVETFGRRAGIDATFRHGPATCASIDRAVCEALYRITQEGLTNIAKHAARTACVSVRLRVTNRYAALVIENDGSEFSAVDEGVACRRSHGGLVGMMNRAASLGGKVDLRCRSEDVVKLIAVLPLLPHTHMQTSRWAS